MQPIDWDVLRYVLAVVDSGSALAAARRLGVNHTTVLRRISAFEKEHGVTLFQHLATGYRATPSCELMIEAARSIDQRVLEIQHDLLGQHLKLEGSITLTTTDTIFLSVLERHLQLFRQAHPRIAVDVTLTNNRLDLTRYDADVAIRPSREPPQTLIGRRLSGLAFAVYGSIDYLAANPSMDMAEHHWVGLGAALQNSPVHLWLTRHVAAGSFAVTAESFAITQRIVEGGAGLAVLPCCLGEPSPRLARFGGTRDEMDTTIWMLTHQGIRNSPKVRLFSDFIARSIRSDRDLLEGRLAAAS